MLTFLMPPLPAPPQIDVPAMTAKQPLLALCAFERVFDQTLENWLVWGGLPENWSWQDIRVLGCHPVWSLSCLGQKATGTIVKQGSFSLDLSLGPSVAFRVSMLIFSMTIFCFLPLVVLLPWPLKESMVLAKASSYWMMWHVWGQSWLSWTVPTANGGSMTAPMLRIWESAVPQKATRSWMAAWVTHLALALTVGRFHFLVCSFVSSSRCGSFPCAVSIRGLLFEEEWALAELGQSHKSVAPPDLLSDQQISGNWRELYWQSLKKTSGAEGQRLP